MLKEVKIEVTDLCDHFCKHCSSSATCDRDNYQALPYDLVCQVIDDVAKLGAKDVIFTGGEATFWPHLEEAIEYAKNKNLNVKLYTLCYRTDENLDLLIRLVEKGLNEIIYSTTINLAKPDTISKYDIKTFMTLLKERVRVKVSFHHVVTKETMDTIESDCDMLAGLNTIDDFKGKISFLRFVPHGRGTDDLVLTEEQFEGFKQLIIKMWSKYGRDTIGIGSPHNILGLNYIPCTAGDETMIVGFDGRVYPCDAIKYFDYAGFAGNIYTKNLEEIYNSTYFKKIRNIMLYAGIRCLECSNFSMCTGGCLGQKLIYYFDRKNEKTFEWYQLNAKRTMNDFKTKELMLFNAATGLGGETGELIDCIKKIFTHNCNEESIESLKKQMTDEIGDIVWYIAAPLLSYHGITFDGIIESILKVKPGAMSKVIDDNIIAYCAKQPDPYCIKKKANRKYKIKDLDDHVVIQPFDLMTSWRDIDRAAFYLRDSCHDKETVIKQAGQLLLHLAQLSKNYLGMSLEEILEQNIDRLKTRYTSGFDSEVTNGRIDMEGKYVLAEPVTPDVKALGCRKSNPNKPPFNR
ncbi:MAG: radical SAM protein [Bacilli bacterium]|jgi:radical SAM protein with 4Fe4S-binding SPASM domain